MESQLCIICCDLPKSVLLMPCKHLCMCEVCGNNEQLRVCPVCRTAIAGRIIVYNT